LGADVSAKIEIDGYGLIQRRQLETDFEFGGKCRTYLNSFGYSCKARLSDCELIDSVGQPLHIEATLIVGRQSLAVLIGLADDLDGCLHPKTGRIGYCEAQFTAIALAKKWQRTEEQKGQKSPHEEFTFPI